MTKSALRLAVLMFGLLLVVSLSTTSSAAPRR